MQTLINNIRAKERSKCLKASAAMTEAWCGSQAGHLEQYAAFFLRTFASQCKPAYVLSEAVVEALQTVEAQLCTNLVCTQVVQHCIAWGTCLNVMSAVCI
jgi:hypothetical protein